MRRELRLAQGHEAPRKLLLEVPMGHILAGSALNMFISVKPSISAKWRSSHERKTHTSAIEVTP
eukprot:6173629-Pleurochrysis_carterae.AAC.1